MLEYYGHFEINMPFRGYESEYENWNAYFLLYKLKNNNFAAKVYEEYLIYDAIGMIGSVGGTLGMFIQFSNMHSNSLFFFVILVFL